MLESDKNVNKYKIQIACLICQNIVEEAYAALTVCMQSMSMHPQCTKCMIVACGLCKSIVHACYAYTIIVCIYIVGGTVCSQF